jgi:hypothetical protein
MGAQTPKTTKTLKNIKKNLKKPKKYKYFIPKNFLLFPRTGPRTSINFQLETFPLKQGHT